jgi:hypothetical protein
MMGRRLKHLRRPALQRVEAYEIPQTSRSEALRTYRASIFVTSSFDFARRSESMLQAPPPAAAR